MKVNEFLRTIDKNTQVAFSTKRDGFMWAGRALFLKTKFLPAFYEKQVLSTSKDKYGNISVIIE